MDEKPSEMPADEFKRLGQNNMTDGTQEDKARTFHTNPNTTYSEYNNNRSKVSKLLIIVLVIIVLLLIGGTVYLFRDRLAPQQGAAPSPTPALETPVVEETPEPTPVELTRSEYTIRILNGTKTSGLAAQVSDKLKGLGYKIERTGNATNSAFERTQVRVKAEATSLLEQIIRDLAGDYSATASSNLKDGDAADAEIILGTE